ncbi:MAG: DinB family protein, partial [Thermoanaerobaculia bacterium]
VYKVARRRVDYMTNELERFIEVLEREDAKTIKLLEALPADGYDFRPDAEGRSLGEMAWHLAEAEGYGTFGVEQGGFSRDARPPGIERPRKIEELASGFARVHGDAVGRLRKLTADDLDRSIPFFTGDPMSVREILWDFILMHNIHHCGQLSMMCRMAGGKPVSLFGPTRETMPLAKPKS